MSAMAQEKDSDSLPSGMEDSQAPQSFYQKHILGAMRRRNDNSSKNGGLQMSFYQRHFCRPISNDPENASKPENRRFSIFSRGFIVTGAIVTLSLITILVAVLATQLNKQHKAKEIYRHPSPLREAIVANFADPAIASHNGTWYAFATNNAAGILRQPQNKTSYDFGLSNVQLAESDNFLNWTVLDHSHDPLPEVGDWALTGLTQNFPQIPRANTWAPSILQRPSDGAYVLYYSATGANHTNHHCVGAALSNASTPAGPYTAVNTSLACPWAEGGAIDPAAFVDKDNTVYVAYKVDGNSIGNGGVCGNTKPPLANTPIRLQKMKDDGITTDGDPIIILDRTAADGPLVEAPSLVRSHEGKYFLFFSSGCTRNPSYNVKYAYADNVTGPYTRAQFPLLETGDWGLLAPGSATVASTSTGGFVMAFHARVSTQLGGVRAMFTTGVMFNGTKVTLTPAEA